MEIATAKEPQSYNTHNTHTHNTHTHTHTHTHTLREGSILRSKLFFEETFLREKLNDSLYLHKTGVNQVAKYFSK